MITIIIVCRLSTHQGKIVFPLFTQSNKLYNLILQNYTGNKGKLPLQIIVGINKPKKNLHFTP